MAVSSPNVDEPIYLLEPLLNTEVRNEKFHLLLKACNVQQVLTCKSDNQLKTLVSAVNARLNEFGQRSRAIQLLRTLLAQCPDNVFVENSLSWMTQCIRAAAIPQTADEACEVLCLLIDMSHCFQALTKSVSGQIVPKLLDTLLTFKKSPAALQCLEAILHYYPGPCKARVKLVEKYLLMFLDEEDKTLVEYASRCICYLPLLLTTGNNDGSTWTNVLTELCATASSLIFELFENVHEATIPSILTELPVGYKLKSLKIGCSVLSRHHVGTRIINIFTFIEGMLLGELTNVKAVRDDLLIALAYRALAVNCNMLSRGKTIDHTSLMCVLPDIHEAAFSLLQTLVSCCGGGLVKYGSLFCKLVLQTLKWTKPSCGYGVERPFSHLREVTYIFLESWVTRAKAASCVELVSEELITTMLQDVYQKKESVTLQFQEKGKTTSQKQLPSKRQQLVSQMANFGSCAAALRALSAIVQTSGSLLSPALHVRLQEVVITLLLEIKLCSGPKEMPAPYSEAGCRTQLFRLLLALTLHPHPRWPPPTQFSLELFSWGQNDCSLEVAGFCNLGVASIRQLVHPSQSSHQFPVSVDEMRASVGLPNLEVVRGINLIMQNEQNKITTENGLDLKSSNPRKPQKAPPPKNSVEENIFQSPNANKPPKKKPRTSFNEVSLNGIGSRSDTSTDTSKTLKKKHQLLSVSDFDKRPSTVSVKSSKKKEYLQFTVEKLVTSSDKTTTSNKRQEWEVTNIVEVKEKPIENKFDKSVKSCETSVGIKRLHNSPKDTEKIVKIRKPNESPGKPEVLINEAPCGNSPDTNSAGNSESGVSIKPIVIVLDTCINGEPSVTINVADINGEPSVTINDMGDNVELSATKNETGANVEASVKINETTEKESNSCEVNEEETVQKKIVEHEEIKEDTGTGVVEDEHENEKRKCGDPCTKNKDALSKQSPLKSSQDKSKSFPAESKVEVRCPVVKPHAVSDCKFKEVNSKPPDVSGCKSNEVESKSPDVSDCKSKEVNISKAALPVVDLHHSSDETESDQKKSVSGSYRRITRSLAKRTSTPHRTSGQQVPIEELPCSQSTSAMNVISRLEEESLPAGIDPHVDLEESDESAPMVLRIESDRESEDIMDVAKNKIDDEASAGKEKNETVTVKQASPLGNPNSPGSKNLKDSVASDREIEEVTEEMEAVVNSPDVTLEEVSLCSEKESVTKKSIKETEEDGSGSETNEEEILASFVDALQPKSE